MNYLFFFLGSNMATNQNMTKTKHPKIPNFEIMPWLSSNVGVVR